MISGKGRVCLVSRTRSKEINLLQIQAKLNPFLGCKVFDEKDQISERFGRFAAENLQFNVLLDLLKDCFS